MHNKAFLLSSITYLEVLLRSLYPLLNEKYGKGWR
jgi:hypothetical protein